MRYKSRRPKLPQSNPWVVMILLWLLAGLVLPKLFKERHTASSSQSFPASTDRFADRTSQPVGLRADSDRTADFATAFQVVSALTQQAGSASVGETYGITQARYDAWRRTQGQPTQSIEQLQMNEVQAIYRASWDQGICGSYLKPLDVVCLDTMITFGAEDGKTFFAALSPDPKTAALDVIRRRADYRRRQTNPAFSYSPNRANRPAVVNPPGSEFALDRALPTINTDPYLRRWIITRDSSGSSPQVADRPTVRPTVRPIDQSPQPDRADTEPSQTARSPIDIIKDRIGGLFGNKPTQHKPALDSSGIYATAKPFTVEVWIRVASGYAPASGIILKPDGLILTNYHVIADDPTVSVSLADGRKFSGQVIASDPTIDLALVQLQGATNLPIAQLADSTKDVLIGNTVYAIGSPEGSHWKMTQAQVMETDSLCGSRALDRKCIRTPEGFLHPGNSGGPLLNSQGEVIGLNRAIQESTGQGVSIPVEIIQSFIRSRE